MHDCLTSPTIIVSSSSLRPLLLHLLLPLPPVLLQGFLQLAGPQSASQEQPGDRETTTTLLQQHSQTQAINTAGEDLIIYFQPGSTPWQNIMARCHRCRPETNPAAPPENRVRLIFGLTSAFFLVFLPSSRCLSLGLMRVRIWTGRRCACCGVYPVMSRSSSGSSTA